MIVRLVCAVNLVDMYRVHSIRLSGRSIVKADLLEWHRSARERYEVPRMGPLDPTLW